MLVRSNLMGISSVATVMYLLSVIAFANSGLFFPGQAALRNALRISVSILLLTEKALFSPVQPINILLSYSNSSMKNALVDCRLAPSCQSTKYLYLPIRIIIFNFLFFTKLLIKSDK